MRKIKLKMWDGEKIIDVKSIDFDDIGNLYHVNGRLVNPSKVKLLQYTGYDDEEWAEIYEGYIVDFMDYSFDGESEYNCRGEIIFEDGAWHITNSISTSELFNYEGGAIKVIGNIFENPELLELN